jgi:hypothetical protein
MAGAAKPPEVRGQSHTLGGETTGNTQYYTQTELSSRLPRLAVDRRSHGPAAHRR